MNFEGKNKDPGTDQINVELIKLLPELYIKSHKYLQYCSHKK